MSIYGKILIITALISTSILPNCYSQSEKLITVIDSITITDFNYYRDTTINLAEQHPIIIVDGIPVNRSQLYKLEIKDVKEINTLPDSVSRVMFDHGRYGVIIINTKLSKRQLKKKL